MSVIAACFALTVSAQTIGTFNSVAPSAQSQLLVLPATHTFQRIIRTGDPLSLGGNMGANNDFTGYVPISGSSRNGRLSISSESTTGEVAILDISYNNATHLWSVGTGGKVTFNPTDIGTVRNFCSGTVTPNNTIIVGEEVTSATDANGDGYGDSGWLIEIDPATRTVINQAGGNAVADKLWAVGNFQHENAVIRSDNAVLYAGADDNPEGFLYKFVPTVPGNFSSGLLYVLTTPSLPSTGSVSGTWVQINNSTQAQRNAVVTAATSAGARNFDRIEDVEIGPDGRIYFAATTSGRIYRFTDNGTVGNANDISGLEVFVGNSTAGVTYDVDGAGPLSPVAWGAGNDNLSFDGEGNLWVLQDGGNNHIWVVRPTHTQASPQVRLFGKTPAGSESTGMTFTPDYKFMFLSIQHPNGGNSASQTDAAGTSVIFNTHTTIVIARTNALGPLATLPVTFTNFTAQKSGTGVSINWSVSEASGHAYFSLERSTDGINFSEIHRNNEDINGQGSRSFVYYDAALPSAKVLYYRIKQCDLNDECKYTEIKTLQFDEKKDFIVYPVPAQDVVNVMFTSRDHGTIRITISDETGRRVLTENKTLVAGRNNFSINITGLRNGHYIITADNGKEKWTNKVIKQ